jgi:hypothetical protein
MGSHKPSKPSVLARFLVSRYSILNSECHSNCLSIRQTIVWPRGRGMSAINGLGAGLVNNSEVGQKPTPMLSPNAPNSFGEAFSLSLSQQVGTDGALSDEMVFSAYGQDSRGDGVATVSMSTGDSAESAYQSMIASINGFGDIGQMGTGGTSAATPSQLDPLFSDLTNALGSNSGTVSVGLGALFPQNVLTQSEATQLQSTPPETLSQFVDSVVASLEDPQGATIVAMGAFANISTNSGNTGNTSG